MRECLTYCLQVWHCLCRGVHERQGRAIDGHVHAQGADLAPQRLRLQAQL